MKKLSFYSEKRLGLYDLRTGESYIIRNLGAEMPEGVEVVHSSLSGKTGGLIIPGYYNEIVVYRLDRHGNLINPCRGVESLEWTWIDSNREVIFIDYETYHEEVRRFDPSDEELTPTQEWIKRQARLALQLHELEKVNFQYTVLNVYRYNDQLVRVNARRQLRWSVPYTGQTTLKALEEQGCPLDYFFGWVDTEKEIVIKKPTRNDPLFVVYDSEQKRIAVNYQAAIRGEWVEEHPAIMQELPIDEN